VTTAETRKLPVGLPLWYVEFSASGKTIVARVVPVEIVVSKFDKSTRFPAKRVPPGTAPDSVVTDYRAVPPRDCYKSESEARGELARRVSDLAARLASVLAGLKSFGK
jgi:hypothetical protein